MKKTKWLEELYPFLKGEHSRDDFTMQEITAAVARLRKLQSDNTLLRAWLFLVKMGIVCDVGGGRYLIDKGVVKAFTGKDQDPTKEAS